MDNDPELTEMVGLNVLRQDGVKTPASGFKFLVQKDVNAVGGIDEKPDIAEAESIIQSLGRLIEAEARELQVCPDETYDLRTLMEALCLIQCFRDGEMWQDTDDGSMMAKSADGLVFKAHRKFSSDERKELADKGHALSDGSYPIPDADALRRAAILARSGHGDVAAAKRLIAKRAKELGVTNPLADNKDAQKDTESAETETSEVTETSADTFTRDDVSKMIADALAETVAKAAEERDKALADLDVLKATPTIGGPAIMAPASARNEVAKSEYVAKAAYHRRTAELPGLERELIAYHKNKAQEFTAKANA